MGGSLGNKPRNSRVYTRDPLTHLCIFMPPFELPDIGESPESGGYIGFRD